MVPAAAILVSSEFIFYAEAVGIFGPSFGLERNQDVILDEVAASMADDQEERREIETYLDQHQLQTFIGDAVNDIVKERPTDPLVTLADALRGCSDASRQIQKVNGRQILNGEALPALEVEILTSQVIRPHRSQRSRAQSCVLCADLYLQFLLLGYLRQRSTRTIFSELQLLYGS